MDARRKLAIKKLIERHTLSVKSGTRQAAREELIREGIYTATGKIAPAYGGDHIAIKKKANG